MIRRMILVLGVTIVLTTSTAGARTVPRAHSLGQTGTAQPNFVVVVTDDQDVASLSAMPNVQRLLQAQGTTFSNAFVSMAACCPSRVSMLRGQYAHNHGVLSNVGENGGFQRFYHLRGEQSTVATWLQAAGYRTALLGKYLNQYPAQVVAPTYVPPGWSEWYSPVGGTHGALDFFDYTLNENGALVQYGNAPRDYSTDVLAAKASDVIRRAAADGQPFFVHLAPIAPHRPTTPAPRHRTAFADAQAPRTPSFNEQDMTDKPLAQRRRPSLTPDQIAEIDELYRQRLRSLLAVDDAVADLVATLRETGTLDQTYVVFTSDNGHFLGEHRFLEGKGTVYEEAIRVPLVVRGPGVAAERVEERLALNIDLAPTLAALAGTEAAAFVDGRSLVPLLHNAGDIDGERWRRVMLIEGQDLRFRALRSAELTYAEQRTGELELYDLVTDPYQMENVAATANPNGLAMLSDRLRELADCAAETCRALEEEPIAPFDATANLRS